MGPLTSVLEKPRFVGRGHRPLFSQHPGPLGRPPMLTQVNRLLCSNSSRLQPCFGDPCVKNNCSPHGREEEEEECHIPYPSHLQSHAFRRPEEGCSGFSLGFSPERAGLTWGEEGAWLIQGEPPGLWTTSFSRRALKIMARKNLSAQECLPKAVHGDSEVTFITSGVFDLLKSSLKTKITYES